MAAYKKVVGIESVNYTSKKTNRQVTGVRLYIASELLPPNVGISVNDVFISGHNANDYHLGDITAVLYEPGFGNSFKCNGVLYVDTTKK